MKSNELISEKLGQVPNDSERHTAPQISAGLVIRVSGCLGITVACPQSLEAHTTLSCNPPTTTCLPFPPTHTQDSGQGQGRGFRPNCRGLGRALLSENIESSLSWSAITQPQGQRKSMASLKAELGPGTGLGQPVQEAGAAPDPGPREASPHCLPLLGIQAAALRTPASDSELQVTSVAASRCRLQSHQGPLPPPPQAISHSGMGGWVGSSNEMHSVLFTNCFQPCGERYF